MIFFWGGCGWGVWKCKLKLAETKHGCTLVNSNANISAHIISLTPAVTVDRFHSLLYQAEELTVYQYYAKLSTSKPKQANVSVSQVTPV